MKILLINDNSAHVNWGAQASPPALTGILSNALPDCQITSLSHAWLARSFLGKMHPVFGGRWFTWDKRRNVAKLFLRRCSKSVPFYPEVADDFDHWADEWLAGRCGPQAKEFLALATEADLIVYNGENSIYRNTSEGRHGIFLLYLTKTRLGKPSCIVNFTIHVGGVRPILSSMAKRVLPVLDLVAVREPCSLHKLQELGINNGELFPDVVFSMDPAQYDTGRVNTFRKQYGLEDQTYFCFSASGLPASMPRGKWDGEVTALIRELKKLGLQAVLVAKDPWCLPLEEVALRTDSVFFGPEHEFHDLWPLFQGASFLVTGHYHYAIFGAMVGCPFVPLSVNNHKMQGVCKHLEWNRVQPFDVTWLSNCRADIVEESRQLKQNRAELGEHLMERAKVLRERSQQLGLSVAGCGDS